MVRVLQVTEMLSVAGIESFLMNIYRHIDKSKVQFDFLVLDDADRYYENEITSMGGHVYYIVSDKKNILLRIRREAVMMYNFLIENKYDIVHIHYTTPLRAPLAEAAEKAGVSTRIYHSHSAYIPGKNIIKMKIYDKRRKQITKHATEYFACSATAAEWMFERKILADNLEKVIHNGIEIDNFKLNHVIRNKIRKDLEIDDKYVLIHTGRFTEQKNQMFIIDIMGELIKKDKNVHLLLLGDGVLKNKTINMARQTGVAEYVSFVGIKSNVADYLSAADCYIMPSKYEGLPVSAIEAECSGLPCVFSTNITQEAGLLDNITFLPLSDNIHEWADAVMGYKKLARVSGEERVRKSGYDVEKVANWLEEFYISRLINGDYND